MKQKRGKFDGLDRDRVVDAIQEHEGVKLQKMGRTFKWSRDASGRNWWILGGKETWHGIPETMMNDEKCAQVEGVLVIAYKKRTRIDVFKGPLGPLVSASKMLSRAGQPPREFHFDVKVSGTRMQCIQIPNVVLDRLVTIPHSEEDRERGRKLDEFQKSISAMSREDLTALMDKLNRTGDAASPGR